MTRAILLPAWGGLTSSARAADRRKGFEMNHPATMAHKTRVSRIRLMPEIFIDYLPRLGSALGVSANSLAFERQSLARISMYRLLGAVHSGKAKTNRRDLQYGRNANTLAPSKQEVAESAHLS